MISFNFFPSVFSFKTIFQNFDIWYYDNCIGYSIQQNVRNSWKPEVGVQIVLFSFEIFCYSSQSILYLKWWRVKRYMENKTFLHQF